MDILIWIALGVVALFVLPNLLADKKTKLFRRVWSTERARPSQAIIDAQYNAVTSLISMYGIKKAEAPEARRKSVAGLMADALTFDMKHPNNSGIEVTQVLARHVRIRFPNLGE